MEINITDEEWEELSPENFETAALLRAVDAVDDLRTDLNDGEDGRPPQFEFAVDLKDQVLGMISSLEQVQETLSQLTALYPESLSYANLDDAD